MDLEDLCLGSAEELRGADLEALMHRCIDTASLVGAFDPTKNLVALVLGIVFAGLAILAVIIHRLVNGTEWWVILEALEACLFGAAAGYGGAVGGTLIAILAPPWLLAALFFLLSAVALLFAILAAVRGDADAGWKVLGFVHFLVLMSGLVAMGVFCSIVPLDGPAASEYQAYVTSVGIGLGIASGIHGILSSVFRGVFYVIGVFFIVVNGTWGFIGNLLGLMTHFASLYFYKDFGRHHEDSSRFCFVCYERGFSLKSNSAGRFAFSEGAVMSADTSSLRRHEAVHVFQHYIFGPVYLVSHFLWFIVMAIPGLIGAAATNVDLGEGVTRMSYYNNPWEVMAYGIANPGGRNTSDALIWGWGAAVTVCVIYCLAVAAAFVVLLLLRLQVF